MAGNVALTLLTIREERIDEFLPVMEKFVVATRKEDGCLRFDLLRDALNPSNFLMYVAHKDEGEFKKHLAQPHFQEYIKWTNTGPEVDVVDQEGKAQKQLATPIAHYQIMRADSTSIGEWAFQDGPCKGMESGSTFLVSMTIRKDRIDDFLKAMKDNVTKSRDQALDPGCLRFDLLQVQDKANPGTFLRFQVFKDAEAAGFHTATDHYKAWKAVEETGVVEKVKNPDGSDSEQPKKMSLIFNTTGIPGGWALQA